MSMYTTVMKLFKYTVISYSDIIKLPVYIVSQVRTGTSFSRRIAMVSTIKGTEVNLWANGTEVPPVISDWTYVCR